MKSYLILLRATITALTFSELLTGNQHGRGKITKIAAIILITFPFFQIQTEILKNWTLMITWILLPVFLPSDIGFSNWSQWFYEENMSEGTLSVLTALSLDIFWKQKQKLPKVIPQFLQMHTVFFIIGIDPVTKSRKYKLKWLFPSILAFKSFFVDINFHKWTLKGKENYLGIDFCQIDQSS